MPRQTATSTVQPRTVTVLAWTLWAIYFLLQTAAMVLAAFGATARDETDLEHLTAEMLRVVDETMQPEFVGVWLKNTPNSGHRV